MSVNNITDPSFENGNAAWDLSDAGARRYEPGDAYDGDWVAEVKLRLGFSPLAGRFGQTFSLFDTSARTFQFRIRRTLAAAPPTDWYVHVDIYDGVQDITNPTPGDKITGATYDGTASTSWTWVVTPLVNPPSTTATIVVWTEWSASGDPPEIGTSIWELDSFEFPDPYAVLTVAKRRDIFDAVITTLGGILISGGYNTDVGDVYEGKRKTDAIGVWPAIHVEYGDEFKRLRELDRKRGDLQLILFLNCKETETKTGAKIADDLAEDVEVILETQTSGQWLSLSYINELLVTGIGPLEVAPEVHRDARVWVMQVDIEYHYDRLAP